MALVITLGETPADYNNTLGAGSTAIATINPAAASGKITLVSFWFNTAATGVIVGTFSGSGTSWTPRDWVTIGNVAAGSKIDFSNLSILVHVGDCIGYYCDVGSLERNTSGSGNLYYKSGNQFGAGKQTYNYSAGKKLAISGSGIQIIQSVPVIPRLILAMHG